MDDVRKIKTRALPEGEELKGKDEGDVKEHERLKLHLLWMTKRRR
jgi:hypothetical protein